MKNPWVAFLLSFFVPGLGQLYVGEKPEAVSLLCITAGLAVALAMSHSGVAIFLIGLIYLFIMVPSAFGAYQTASGKPRTFKSDAIPYVLVMLLGVGPFAIPLLWQSSRFSRGAKVFWTVLVTLIAVAAVLAMTLLASYFDELMKQNAGTIPF